MQTRALVLPGQAIAFEHESSRPLSPANRAANIAAVDAVDIRLRRLPTSAAAEAPVSSSLGAGSRKADRGTVSTRLQPFFPLRRTGSAGRSGQLAVQHGPSGACHWPPRASTEGLCTVRPRGKPDSPDQARLGGAQRSVP